MKGEMKRDRGDFFPKNVSEPSNPSDELAQKVSKKNPRRTIYSSIFSAKVQNLAVFFIYLHDSNSIFWAQGIKSEWVLGRTVYVHPMCDGLCHAVQFAASLSGREFPGPDSVHERCQTNPEKASRAIPKTEPSSSWSVTRMAMEQDSQTHHVHRQQRLVGMREHEQIACA